MKIYIYDKSTKEFIRETNAYLDLEKSRELGDYVYIIPENCTTEKPPKLQKNEQCIFNEEWIIVKDYRNQKFYDTKNNKTVIIHELGDVPKHFIKLNSDEFKKYLKGIDPNTIRNNLKQLIEELYQESLQKFILFGKYYFTLAQLAGYEKLSKEIESDIRNWQEEIKNIDIQIAKSIDVDEKNNLKLQQLELYKKIDNIQIELTVKNKRRKEVKFPCTYEEFNEVLNTLRPLLRKLEVDKGYELLKLSHTIDEDLILYEQRLRRKGITFNEKTRNETTSKGDRKTS